MKKMWIVYALIAAVIYLVGNTLYVAGSFKSIQKGLSGEVVREYAGIYGPEDMELDGGSSRLYISSANRRRVLCGLSSDDHIWVLDVDSINDPIPLVSDYVGEFHPHGISLLRKQGTTYLFVVNHNGLGNYVERFMVQGDTIRHQRTFSDPLMCCPNDVYAVDTATFYVTNDHGTSGGFSRTLEDYGRLPLSSLLYVNNDLFVTACDGLRYANGVNGNKEGTRIYVAATTGRSLITFERDTSTGVLKEVATLPLKTGVDNIDVDEDGNLWIAAHPKLLAFVAHAKDSLRNSPSQVLRLKPQPGDQYIVEEMFMDDGSLISGSSIAVRSGNRLFVGGVFQPRILLIKLRD